MNTPVTAIICGNWEELRNRFCRDIDLGLLDEAFAALRVGLIGQLARSVEVLFAVTLGNSEVAEAVELYMHECISVAEDIRRVGPGDCDTLFWCLTQINPARHGLCTLS